MVVLKQVATKLWSRFPDSNRTASGTGEKQRATIAARYGIVGFVGAEEQMDTSPSFGVWLRQRRKALDLTQDELGSNQ